MSIDLGRRLIAAGLCAPDEVEAALFLSVARGVPFTRVLIDRGVISERGLEDELERVGGLGLRQVTGAAGIWTRLPRALCRRLAALPTRVDPATGAVDVAAADPLDPHVTAEFSFHLGVPIRVLRAPIAAVEEAIRRLELDEAEPHDGARERARHRRVTPPFPHGAPQSSIPPPLQEAAPIPLVRKIHAGGSDNGGAVQTAAPGGRTGGTLVPPTGAPPLARLAIPAPRALSGVGSGAVRDRRTPITPEAPAVNDGAPLDRSRALPQTPVDDGAPLDRSRALPQTPAHDQAPAVTAPSPRLVADPPAVSFPSTPPSTVDRITPPYGTPVYDPRTAGVPGALPAHTVGRTARPPDPGYRIAPPADDPYPITRAAPDERQPPAVPLPSPLPARTTTLPSATWPTGPRRPARPALGDVPYPAAVHAQPPGSRRGSLPDEETDEAVLLGPSARKLRAPDGGPVLEALRQATSRDEVIRIAMRGMRLVSRRLAVFAVKRDGFYGWACNVDLGDAEALRALRIPADQPSVLATAAATAIYLGPIPATPAHEGLLRVIERASSDVAAVAVRVAGRPALVLLCDELSDTMIATRFLVELSRSAGEALARLIAPR